jgi:hypothetical protein
VIPRSERVAIRTLSARRTTAENPLVDHPAETASEYDSPALDAAVAAAILKPIAGARVTDARAIANLFRELQRLNGDGSVCGSDFARPFEESIRLAGAAAGVSVDAVLAHPEVVRRLCELTA